VIHILRRPTGHAHKRIHAATPHPGPSKHRTHTQYTSIHIHTHTCISRCAKRTAHAATGVSTSEWVSGRGQRPLRTRNSCANYIHTWRSLIRSRHSPTRPSHPLPASPNRPTLSPTPHTHTHICIYIYICQQTDRYPLVGHSVSQPKGGTLKYTHTHTLTHIHTYTHIPESEPSE